MLVHRDALATVHNRTPVTLAVDLPRRRNAGAALNSRHCAGGNLNCGICRQKRGVVVSEQLPLMLPGVRVQWADRNIAGEGELVGIDADGYLCVYGTCDGEPGEHHYDVHPDEVAR